MADVASNAIAGNFSKNGVPLGRFVAYSISGSTIIGLTVEPDEPGDDAWVLSLLPGHFEIKKPGLYTDAARSSNAALIFPDAVAVPSDDVAHIHIDRAPTAGALVVDATGWSVVVSDGGALRRYSMAAGQFIPGSPGRVWFSQWSIARPSADGRLIPFATIVAG